MRKPGTKKGQVVGSGGRRRRGLEGKGPTPKAEDRPYHKAARRKGSSGAGGAGGGRGAAPGRRRQGGGRGSGRPGAPEVVAGRNSVLEALRAEVPVKTIHVAERVDSDDRIREIVSIAAKRGLPVLEAPRTEIDRISGGAVHQGVALTLPPYEYAHPDDLLDRAAQTPDPALIVALDGVTDPRNLGAVIRSAAAFGAHGVVVPERRSAGMTAGAWKTSAGAAIRLPVARATNLARTLRAYQEAGLFVVGLDGSGDAEIGAVAALDAPLCLVVGSEGEGMSRIVRQTCDQVARIPMTSGVESLNAGVAAGIALYEVSRARQ